MNAYYWFNKKHGPRKGALVCKDGSVVHLDYRNHADTFKVRDTKDVVGLVNLVPAEGTWSGSARSRVNRGTTLYVRDLESAEYAAAALLDALGAEEEAERKVVLDPAAHLERELARCDWYSHFSDDHGVWAAGERHMAEIRALTEKVPVETARALWAKYAPADATCPV
jgi:hypothetical protein